MDLIKVSKWIIVGGFIGLQVTACSNSSSTADYVSKEKFEAQIEEYKKLNEKQAAIINDNIEKSSVINNVVSELRLLTGATTTLRHNVELGDAQETQAQEIKKRLDALKQKLNKIQNVKKSGNDNLLETIANLQQIIVQKESEIIQLQQQITAKEEKIRLQELTINQQHIQLLQKQQDLWYQLGESLHSVVKELPKVKGRKDKRNIKNTRLYILNKSLECFEQAKDLGHVSASVMCEKVEREIEAL